MKDPDINLGVVALYKHAQTQLYKPAASWSTSKDFILTDYLVHSVGYAPTSLDFQSNAFTRLA